MSQFYRMGVLKTIKNTFRLMYEPIKIQKMINSYTKQVRQAQQNSDRIPIIKLNLYDFKTKQAIQQWTTASDRQIGGDSQINQLQHNQQDKCITVGGTIKTKNKQILKQTPFLGLLHTHPYRLKTGIFNTFRVQLKTDGMPIEIQMIVFSPIIGYLFGRAFIINKNIGWETYQLPFRNFQILGEEAYTKEQKKDKSRMTISRILDEQMSDPHKFQISNIAFRFPSTEDTERSISIRNIQLARTIRGHKIINKIYDRPYFYIVQNPNQTKDHIYKTLDTGSFSTTIQIPKNYRKYLQV